MRLAFGRFFIPPWKTLKYLVIELKSFKSNSSGFGVGPRVVKIVFEWSLNTNEKRLILN